MQEMRKNLVMTVLAAVLAVAACSCSRGPRVIPVHKMEKIYREMFLADQWLANNPEKRAKADTTWFYEPIFEKYGYNVEDYRYSVDHYLNDPKRYSDMLRRVAIKLENDAASINRSIAQQEKMRHQADSIAQAIKNMAPDDFPYYSHLFYVNSMTDRIDIQRNARGAWFPVPVVEDTVYHGPELIVRDTSAVEAADTLSVEGPVPAAELLERKLVPSKTSPVPRKPSPERKLDTGLKEKRNK